MYKVAGKSFHEMRRKNYSFTYALGGNLIGTGKSICHANALCTVQNSCISLYDLGLLMV